MLVFYSYGVDVIFIATVTAFVIGAAQALRIAEERQNAEWRIVWRLLAITCAVLAARGILPCIGVAEIGVAVKCAVAGLLVAAGCLLYFAGLFALRSRANYEKTALLVVGVVALSVSAGLFMTLGEWNEFPHWHWSSKLLFSAKCVAFLPASLVCAALLAKSGELPNRLLFAVWLLPIYALVIVLAPIPVVSSYLETQTRTLEIFGLSMHCLGALAASALAGVLWTHHIRTHAFAADTARRQASLFALIILVGSIYILFSTETYRHDREQRLLALAQTTAFMIDAATAAETRVSVTRMYDALAAAETNAGDTAVAGEFPRHALFLVQRDGETVMEIGRKGRMRAREWDDPPRELLTALKTGTGSSAGNAGHIHEPVYAFAPVRGAEVLFVAVKVSAKDWAREMFIHKRPAVIAVFAMLFIALFHVFAQAAPWSAAPAKIRDSDQPEDGARQAGDFGAGAQNTYYEVLAHELRNAAAGVVHMADTLLYHENATAEIRLYAESIVRAAKSFQRVADEMVEALAENPATAAGTAIPFDLLSFVEEAVLVEAVSANARGVDLRIRFTPYLPCNRMGDVRRLRFVLLRLVRGCLREAAGGDVTITVSAAKGVLRDGVLFAIAFKGGENVTAESIARFVPESGPPGTESTPATGEKAGDIGEFVKCLGGTLDLYRAYSESKSTICRFTLPLPIDAEITDREAPNLTGLRALVVSHDSFYRDTIIDCLAMTGAFCDAAADPAAMLRKLRASYSERRKYHMLIMTSSFTARLSLAKIMADVYGSEAFGHPKIMLLVSSRDMAIGFDKYEDVVTAFAYYPLLPSDLWAKAAKIWEEEQRSALSPGVLAASDGFTAALAEFTDPAKQSGVRIKAKVLLVEDNPVEETVIKNILLRIGCSAVSAQNGREAVKHVADGEDFDMILMKCAMPVMDGMTATQRIRELEGERPGTKRHVIVALADSAGGDGRESCFAQGLDGRIVKPVTLEELRDTLILYCPDKVVPAHGDEDRM